MIYSPDKYRLLVVEDESTQRLKLEGILTGAGYRVEVACNGVEGLAFAQSNPPHLVLSDIEMPEMDGYELCQRIREDQHLRGTKVVLLTSHSDVADVIYKCTELYDAADDRGIAWNDARIGITWPIEDPIVSAKDSARGSLSETRNDLPRYS